MQSEKDIEQMMEEIAKEESYPISPQSQDNQDGGEEDQITDEDEAPEVGIKPGTVPNIDGAGR